MKKTRLPRLAVVALAAVLILAGPLFLVQEAEACRPGTKYVEGTRVIFCWGKNGDDCKRCVKV